MERPSTVLRRLATTTPEERHDEELLKQVDEYDKARGLISMYPDTVEGKPVGSYRPNPFGLFDLGSMQEFVVEGKIRGVSHQKQDVVAGNQAGFRFVRDEELDELMINLTEANMRLVLAERR
jgi:hypothetical protein